MGTMQIPRPARWRAFGARRYRPFHAIAAGQGFTGSLAADALFVPFLLHLGASPSLVILVGATPVAGTALQALVPDALRRLHGDLRRLTLLLALSELRGFVLAGVAAGVAAGVLPAVMAIALVAMTVGLGQTLGYLSASNITLLTAVVLPEDERRLVAPRMGAAAMALQTMLLVPTGLVLDGAVRSIGVWAYVGLFVLSGCVSVLTPLAVRRLPNPGRVRVAERGGEGREIPAPFRRFIRATAIGSFGQGVLPYLALYAMQVLGGTAGFAVVLSGIASAGSLIGSLVAGSFLLHGSASRALRASFYARALAAALCVGALPGNPLAPVLLLAGAALFNGGGNAGALATNERLYRLAPPEGRVHCQGAFVGWTSAAAASGAVVCAAALALTITPAWLPYAGLYVLSGASRTIAGLRLEVTASWRSPARAAPLAERGGSGEAVPR